MEGKEIKTTEIPTFCADILRTQAVRNKKVRLTDRLKKKH